MMHTHDTRYSPRRQQRTWLRLAAGAPLVWLALLPLAAQERAADNVLIITLRPTTTTRATVVPVGVVATVRGGTPSLRRKVAELDLAELKPDGNVVAVGSEQVSFRLQLAGIEPAAFRVEGRQALVGLAPEEVTEESLLAVATQAVRERLPPFVDNVSILRAQPIQIPDVKIEAADRIRIEARPAPGLNPFGLIRLPVAVIKNGDCCAVIPIYLNVNYVSHASAAERERDENNPILVKPRDMVRLVARVGALRVTALGEALQEGRHGETVRVRNVDSSKVVAGRVADAQVVEIDY
jgi:hypothetical protein